MSSGGNSIDLAITVRGYITQDKYLVGQSLDELERRLGFHRGRLAWGATIVRLARVPLPGEFELAAYSMTAEHRHKTPSDLDIPRLKQMVGKTFQVHGRERLVKVLPVTRHNALMDRDEQYPPGSGVPQWKIVGAGIPGLPLARILPGMRYVPRP